MKENMIILTDGTPVDKPTWEKSRGISLDADVKFNILRMVADHAAVMAWLAHCYDDSAQVDNVPPCVEVKRRAKKSTPRKED